MNDIVKSVVLILLSNIVGIIIKHFADKKDHQLLAEQNTYLKKIAESTSNEPLG